MGRGLDLTQRHRLAGAALLAGLAALALGTLPRLVPSGAAAGALARLLDSLAPGFLALALGLGLLALATRARRLGGALSAATLAAAAHLVTLHLAVSQPAAPTTPDLRLLFLNAFRDNPTPDRLLDDVLRLGPDIAVLAEAEALRPALDRLRSRYAFVSPCEPDSCEIVIAARRAPLRFWQLQLSPAWPARYAVAEFQTETGARFFLVGTQLAKPWLSGLAEPELARLIAQFNWLQGPAIVLGDFNAAPWSRPMQDLLSATGFKGPRLPPATWPVGAGPLGLPLDQVLVRGGPRVVRVQTVGPGLGSNHLGLLAEIALGVSPR